MIFHSTDFTTTIDIEPLNTDKEIFHAAKVFGLKYNNDVTAVEKEIKREWNALSCIEIEIEHMTGKEAIELTRERG